MRHSALKHRAKAGVLAVFVLILLVYGTIHLQREPKTDENIPTIPPLEYEETKKMDNTKVAPTSRTAVPSSTTGSRRGRKQGKLRLAAAITSIAGTLPVAVAALLNQGITVYGTGDQRGPPKNWQTKAPSSATGRLHFKTAQEQAECTPNSSAFCEFLHHMPWNHFARKNIAYLMAVKDRKADFLWDFDDDNIPLSGFRERLHRLLADNRRHRFGLRGVSQKQSLNPYPTLSASDFIYPRGFPLEDIKDTTTYGGELVKMAESVPNNTVVFQVAADGNPDVDAIFRLTRNYNIRFRSILSALTLDNHHVAPYNAQATLHRKAAFWCLYLPITVTGRVSDIWRSYISQALFRLFDFNVAFTSPLVEHERSPHNLVNDLKMESRMYVQSGKMIKFLNKWTERQKRGNRTTVGPQELMIHLYEKLVQARFLGQQDVIGIRLWIRALDELKYRFPKRPIKLLSDRQVMSPKVDRFPIFADVFQSIQIPENHWEVIGPLRSIHARSFPNYRLYVARHGNTAIVEPCLSPFPDRTACWRDHRGFTGHFGTTAYYSYLDAVRLLYNYNSKEADFYTDPPEYLLWHHDDLFVNLTTLRHQLNKNNRSTDDSTTGFNWLGVFLRRTLVDSETTTVDLQTTLTELRKGWGIWEPRTSHQLEQMFREKRWFFRQNNTICSELLMNTMSAFDEIGSATNRGHNLTRLQYYMHRVISVRGHSDFLLTKWKEVRLFNKNLQLLCDHDIMLEIAMRVALRCSYSRNQIRNHFDTFQLATSFDKKRNEARSMAEVVETGGIETIHPLKIALSQDHLSIALMFRDKSV